MNYVKPTVEIVDFAAMERLASLRLDGELDTTSILKPSEDVGNRDDFSNP